MKAEEKLTRAKTSLILRHPYFGLLAGRLRLEADEDVATFVSDGKALRYNPDYVASLNVEEAAFILANSAMHHVLAHENRRRDRLGWLWQLATDYAINAMLVGNGFTPPPNISYDERFANMYAEEIYAVLKEEIKNEAYDDDSANEEGYNEQNLPRRRRAQRSRRRELDGRNGPSAQTATEWEAAHRQALGAARAQGAEPKGIERLWPKRRAETDWRGVLYRALVRHQKRDYTYLRPNRKAIGRGVYLPSLAGEALKIVVAVDSSGSIDEALLGRFMAELEGIFLAFADVEATVLVCDDRIRSVFFFDPVRPPSILQGGAGTDFRPVFRYIKEHLGDTSLLLYFTDGAGTFPSEVPLFEVIWAMPERREVPFGEVVVLD